MESASEEKKVIATIQTILHHLRKLETANDTIDVSEEVELSKAADMIEQTKNNYASRHGICQECGSNLVFVDRSITKCKSCGKVHKVEKHL